MVMPDSTRPWRPGWPDRLPEVDQGAYPGVFGVMAVPGAPVDARFRLVDGGVDGDLVASAYVVPFLDSATCVVLGFGNGDWSLPGGTVEPGEGWAAALERELIEEANARLCGAYTPFGVLACHSRASGPYRPHLPHPDYFCLYGYAQVELLTTPRPPATGGEQVTAVTALPAADCVAFLDRAATPWDRDLYRLAIDLRQAWNAAPPPGLAEPSGC
jgi:8-oxo-dGTP diphosphatase